jgi:hypothetical protein
MKTLAEGEGDLWREPVARVVRKVQEIVTKKYGGPLKL